MDPVALQSAVTALQTHVAANVAAINNIISGQVVAPPVTSGAVSPDGTVVVAPATGTLTDKSGNTWSFGTLYTAGGAPGPDYDVMRNGAWYGRGGAQQMTIYAGVVYVLNSADQWWKDNGAGGWSSSASPVSTTTTPPVTIPPVTTPPGTVTTTPGPAPTPNPPASTKPSPFGSTITGPTTSSLTDVYGAVWMLGAPSEYGFWVYRNGVQWSGGLSGGGQAQTLALDNTGVIWGQANTADPGANAQTGHWYQSTQTGWMETPTAGAPVL